MKRYSRKYGGSTYAQRLARRTRNTFRPASKYMMGGSTYAHRLARRTRNTFRPVAKFLGPIVQKFGPALVDMALSKLAGKGRRYTRGRGFFGDLARKGIKKYGSQAVSALSNKAKSYVGDNSLASSFIDKAGDYANQRVAGMGRRRKHRRYTRGHGFFSDMAKKAAKKYAPSAINMLAAKAKSYVGDNSLASQFIDKGASYAQSKVGSGRRRKSMRHMLKYSRHKRLSRKRSGGALFGSALMPAGYGMSRGRRGRGLRSRKHKSKKHRSMRHLSRKHRSRKSHKSGCGTRRYRGRGMMTRHSGLAYPRG